MTVRRQILSPTGPRAVRLQDDFVWQVRGLEVFIAALLLGGPLLIDNATADARGLEARGVKTLATVTGRTRVRESTSQRNATPPTSTLGYRYEIGGRTYRGRREISTARYFSTQEGAPLTLIYLPERPQVHVLDGVPPGEGEARRDRYRLYLFGGCGILSLIAIGWRSAVRRQRAMLREWPALEGVVVDRPSPHSLRVEVPEMGVQTIHAHADELGDIEEGAMAPLLRNPNDPADWRLVSTLRYVEIVTEERDEA